MGGDQWLEIKISESTYRKIAGLLAIHCEVRYHHSCSSVVPRSSYLYTHTHTHRSKARILLWLRTRSISSLYWTKD